MTLFKRLYNITREIEAKEDAPAFIYGIFSNTAESHTGAPVLDVEYVRGGSALLWDNDDLIDFLDKIEIAPADVEKALSNYKKEVEKL